jgi:hypothetical protein
MDGTYQDIDVPSNLGRWNRAAYFQDDWKATQHLTINAGIRYDYFSPSVERLDHQAEFYSTGPLDVPAGGSGVFVLPSSQQNVPLSPVFTDALAEDNITIKYSNNRALVTTQHANFAPRLGLSYQVSKKLVVRSGFGLYYGGIENIGNFVNLGVNYPFDTAQSFAPPSCLPNDCPSDGFKLETGIPSSGLTGLPSLVGVDPHIKTSYAMQQNLSVQYAISNNTSATVAYVGSESRHLAVVVWVDGSAALLPPGVSSLPYEPFPAFNDSIYSTNYGAIGNYNSFQAKVERHFSHGLSFLGSYTLAHNLDDAREPLPDTDDGGDRAYNIIGLRPDYSNSPFDVRQRFTFTATYQLPFGKGRAHMNKGGIENILLGGWNATMLFRGQTGNPFTVDSNTTVANGAQIAAFPYLVANPFKGGGTPQASNPGIPCPTTVRTLTHWFNPCAFADPPLGSTITAPITGAANVLPYLGSPRSQIYGPGYKRIDATLTKDFPTIKSQYLQFRADIFNLTNTPTWGPPSNTGTGPLGGLITGAAFLGNYTPDARFFQLAAKYYF